MAQSNAPTSPTPSQTESSESGESGGTPGQTQESEIEPLQLDAQPAAEIAQSAPGKAEPATERLRNPLRKVAEPAAEKAPEPATEVGTRCGNCPETVAQSNAPTSANPEKSESENLQKTKADSVHINQLLKGTLDRPLPEEEAHK